MRTHIIRAAVTVAGIALAAAAAAGLGTGGASTAHASAVVQSVRWRTAWTGSRYGTVLAVTAPAKNSAWAFGAIYRKDAAFLVHWNGSRWREFAFPVKGYTPLAIGSSSATNVWMFGFTKAGQAEALALSGRRWIAVAEPDIGQIALTGVVVLGPADVWLAAQGTIYHDLGGIWSKSELPASFTQTEIGGTSDRNMWAVGTRVAADGTSEVAAYRWTGDGWRSIRMPHPASGSANILAESATSVWITSSRKILRLNGSRWTEIANGNSPVVGPLAPHGAKGLWVTAYELWTGSSWVTVLPDEASNVPVFDNSLAHIPGTRQTWLAGDSSRGAVIMRSAG